MKGDVMLAAGGARQADILEVIADLSNDEVFTPPRLVNEMLDLLPESVWTDPTLRWLDPGTKTGVFLREVAKRLLVGLSDQFVSTEDCLEHILGEMLHGIAITELTSLLARRSLYCSKDATSDAATVRMPNPDGNVWFDRSEHTLDKKERCVECGSQVRAGNADAENHAYGFVHLSGRRQWEKVMPSTFDVILGNPPYQLSTGQESAQAVPIYHRFIQTAIDLNPKYLLMVVPTRWMVGGMGLGDFRKRTLADRRMATLFDFPNGQEVFPTVNIKGGVCYFLWDAAHDGPCRVVTVREGERVDDVSRTLDEFDVFIRSQASLEILRQVRGQDDSSIIEMISAQKPYGLPTNARSTSDTKNGVKVVAFSGGKRTDLFVKKTDIAETGMPLQSWRVLVPKAGSDGGQRIPDPVLGQPQIVPPGVACTESFIAIGPFASEEEATNFEVYLRTRFFRFLVSLRKITQDALRNVYRWVPQQELDRAWTDEELFDRYGLSEGQRAHIVAMVKEL
jgi:site-specific DNA-methyltransferase (adenine-specific)